MMEEIGKTEYGKEYLECGFLKGDIMDGYDAGWLSPSGDFYGSDGQTSEFIHLRIAEKLTHGDMDGDTQLEKQGWVKIHHDEVYGCFIGRLNDSSYPYAPTEIQVSMICDYINKFHNGVMHTKPKIIDSNAIVKVSQLRQMDIHKLHDVFE